MKNILKVTLKKDVCDNLTSGKTNKIYFDTKPYWVKRLSSASTFEELKTDQSFKEYDEIEISFGTDKFTYTIEKIEIGVNEENTEMLVVIINNPNSVLEKEVISDVEKEETLIEEKEEEILIEEKKETLIEEKEEETVKTSTDTVVQNPVDSTTKPIVSKQQINLDQELALTLESYTTFPDVIQCGPMVILGPDGWVSGHNRKLKNVHNTAEERVYMKNVLIQHDCQTDEDFITKVELYLEKLLISNYVFLNINNCKLVHKQNNTYFLLRAGLIKKY